MYKFERYRQLGLADFNQPVGLKMNQENRWIKKAETIPWDAIEEKYARLFPSKTGMPAKPLRMALGSLLIQKQLGFVFPVFHRTAGIPDGTSLCTIASCRVPQASDR